jgi:tetratricopeptide (TPR) repeat protein
MTFMRPVLRTQYLWLAGLGVLFVVTVVGHQLFPEFMSRYQPLVWSLLLGWGIAIPLYRTAVFMKLGRAGKQACERGDFLEGERCYARLVKKAENLWPGGSLLPTYLMDLAIVYRVQARYAEAESLHMRAEECWRAARKQNAEFRANNLANLALVYHQQARYDEAEAILYDVLGRSDEDHFKAAYRIFRRIELGQCLSDRGRYQKAALLFEESRAIASKELPARNPLLAVASLGLADCYAHQGRIRDALDLAQESLAALERVFGRDHHYETAVCHLTLAEIYRLQGAWAEAESSARAALAIWEKAHGPRHPTVATALHRLALILGSQGKLDEARSLCERTLTIRQETLGRDHPDTIASRLYSAEISQA